MARRKKSTEILCRFCGDACPNERDALSHWSHHHPSVCPYRTDRVPALNGVHVGDVWSGHRCESRVIEIRLGGDGVYTDREATVLLEDIADGYVHVMPTPLWSLVECYDPVTRPGEYPVPIEDRPDRWSGKPRRWAVDAWRTPAYRRHGTHELERVEKWPDMPKRRAWAAYCSCGMMNGWHSTKKAAEASQVTHADEEANRDKDAAYWHSYHSVGGYMIGWEATNRIWQIDQQLEHEAEQIRNALAGAAALLDDPLLGKTAASLVAAFSEEEAA